MKNNLIQFLKFGLVGISNTLISLIVYYIWMFLIGNYIQAVIVAWILSVLNAFYWNKKYVFNSRTHLCLALIKTYLSYGASLVISVILLVILIERLGVSTMIAPLISLIVTVPINFLLNKFWAFG